MASETITKNDLTNILNEVLPPTPSEYKKLLWTNPNPASSFAAQTVSLDLSGYDEVQIDIAGTTANTTTTQSFSFRVGIGGLSNISANNIWWRYITPSSTGVEFGTGYVTQTYGGNGTTDNGKMIPQRIYGIKYTRVASPQIEIEETFNNVEAVASLPYTPSHSGILTLYMLQNGTSAVWRSVRITDQTTNTHTDFGIYFAGTTYGGASFHLPVIKGHTYIVASGGSDLYFEASRSYLTY